MRSRIPSANKMNDPHESNTSFPKSIRLRAQEDFDRVYGSQFVAADKTLVVKAIANNSAITRLGLSVSKKVGNAVVRNKWKRLIREAFRLQKTKMPPGLDLVVRPRKGATCDFDSVFASLVRLANKIARQIECAKN